MRTTRFKNMLAALAALFIALFALPQKAVAEDYDLQIAGKQVTSANCNDLSVIPGVSGTVSYDPATKTLTLEDATIAATGDFYGIWGYIDDLTVRVKGTVNVTAQGNSALGFTMPATLTGNGTLNATSNTNTAIRPCETDLTIDGLTVHAKGIWGIGGWKGMETLTVRNAAVTAEGDGKEGSIRRFKTLTLDGCAITQPAGAAFSASLKGVALDGQLVKEKVRIEPATRYDLKIAGTQVTSANCGDLSVIPGVTGTAKYDHSTKTLTLEDAAIAATGNLNAGIWANIDGLTVRVTGTVNITSQEREGILFSKPATLTGGGTLNTTGGDSDASCGIFASAPNLTIDGLTVNAKGKWGIAGNDGLVETLTVRNATVTAEGDGTDGSLLGFKSLTLDGCEIIQPTGAAFSASLKGVALGGQLVKEKVRIEPVTQYDLWIAGTKVTSTNCADLSVLPGVTGTANYDPTTKTLTLDNAAITMSGYEISGIDAQIDGLTVRVRGTVNVTAQNKAALAFYHATTLTGGGTLHATSNEDVGILAHKTDLTLDGLTVHAKGKWGIAGNDGSVETLTIKNATVTAEGDGTEGSLCNWKALALEGCAITQPSADNS